MVRFCLSSHKTNVKECPIHKELYDRIKNSIYLKRLYRMVQNKWIIFKFSLYSCLFPKYQKRSKLDLFSLFHSIKRTYIKFRRFIITHQYAKAKPCFGTNMKKKKTYYCVATRCRRI
jgi:hypothetical protein